MLATSDLLHGQAFLYYSISHSDTVFLMFTGARTPEVNNARSKLDGVLQGLVHKKDDFDR